MQTLNDVDQSKVNELLAKWEAAKSRGDTIPDEVLCRDHLHLLDAVRQGIQVLSQSTIAFSSSTQPPRPPSDSTKTLPESFANGRYVIRGELGKGGMGVVYRAWDQKRQCEVALKTLPCAEGGLLLRFKQEFRVLADLYHPNLVVLHELCAEGSFWFFTMELIAGTTFLDYVRPSALGRVLDEQRLRDCLLQLAGGVQYLHSAGQLHRDLKPSNVMVTENGRVVLLDFGLAAELNQMGMHKSQTGQIFGTIGYMAPEQAAGESVTPASDWYAVGVMVYQALSGKLPFGSSLQSLLNKRTDDPPPLTELDCSTSKDLADICMAMIQRLPKQRATGHELLALLQSRSSNLTNANSSTPFVGRVDLLSLLSKALELVRQGKAVGLTISGPSGVGKSALLRHFFQQLPSNYVVLQARCFEREAVPFKAIDGAVDALCRHLQRLPDEMVHALLPRKPGPLAQVFPVLGAISAMAASLSKVADTLDAPAIRQRAFVGLRELLARLGDRGPVILMLDDVQWGDLDSAALLTELLHVPDPPALLTMIVYRAEMAQSPVTVAFRQSLPVTGSETEQVDLLVPPLSTEEVGTLTKMLLGQTTDTIIDAIAHESAGLPFFVHELTKVTTQGQVPTLATALELRIARLPETSRKVLEAVAVAGVPVPAAACLRVAGLPSTDLETLNTLHNERLIRRSGNGTQIIAYHDRVSDTVASFLPAESISTLLQKLVLELAKEQEVNEDTLAALCLTVHQRVDTQSVTEVLQATLQAAERANSTLAFDRAAQWYKAALDLPNITETEFLAAMVSKTLRRSSSGLVQQTPVSSLEEAAVPDMPKSSQPDAKESTQRKLGRVRKPRVKISYDVETNGALQKQELPFVVGVLADLSAQRTEPLPPLKDRNFVEVDRDNINNVMKNAAPEIQISVANKLTEGSAPLNVPLKFRSIDDFQPAKVAEQIPALKELLEMRQRLEVVLGKIEGNVKLKGMLQEVLANTEKVKELAKEMGFSADQPASNSSGITQPVKKRYSANDEILPGIRVISHLGAGSFGDVYRVSTPGSVEKALKIIKLQNTQGIREFNALKLIKKIGHPNLVSIDSYWLRDQLGKLIDFSSDDSFNVEKQPLELIILMGFGQMNLHDKLRECLMQGMSGIPFDELIELMSAAAKAIDYLNKPHDLGLHEPVTIQHGNVKPGNFLLVGNSVQVSDYGLAKAITTGKSGGASIALFSPAYSSPESNRNQSGKWSDQFSLAITYYELRTGKLPFNEEEEINAGIVAALGKLDFSGVPKAEQEVLRKATNPIPNQRYHNCVDLINALRATGDPSARDSEPQPWSLDEILQPGSEIVPGYKLEQRISQDERVEFWKTSTSAGKPYIIYVIRELRGPLGNQLLQSVESLRKLDEYDNLINLRNSWMIHADGKVKSYLDMGILDHQAVAIVSLLDNVDCTLEDYYNECLKRHATHSIPEHELQQFMMQAAKAVDYLAKQGHTEYLDLKPHTILLTKNKTVKLGIAGFAKRLMRGSSAFTTDRLGIAFAPPELFDLEVGKHWNSNQYSLALTYYWLRSLGHLPFPADPSPDQIREYHLRGQLDFSDVPEREQNILFNATAFDPNQRFASCCEFVVTLQVAMGVSVPKYTSPMQSMPISPRSTPMQSTSNRIEYQTPASPSFQARQADYEFADDDDLEVTVKDSRRVFRQSSRATMLKRRRTTIAATFVSGFILCVLGALVTWKFVPEKPEAAVPPSALPAPTQVATAPIDTSNTTQTQSSSLYLLLMFLAVFLLGMMVLYSFRRSRNQKRQHKRWGMPRVSLHDNTVAESSTAHNSCKTLSPEAATASLGMDKEHFDELNHLISLRTERELTAEEQSQLEELIDLSRYPSVPLHLQKPVAVGSIATSPKQVRSIQPWRSQLELALGDALAHAGRHVEAIEAYQRALTTANNEQQLVINMKLTEQKLTIG